MELLGWILHQPSIPAQHQPRVPASLHSSGQASLNRTGRGKTDSDPSPMKGCDDGETHWGPEPENKIH